MKKYLKFAISLAITTGCFWWTFRGVKTDELMGAVKSANYWWALLYLLILTGVHIARTLRWGNLLSGIEKVKFRALNEASGIGFMMLIILPFRMGEFARPFLIAERSTIRRSAAMTSVVLERIADGLLIAVMLRILMFYVPNDHGQVNHVLVGVNMMFAVFGGGFLFLVFARWQHERAVRLIAATAGRVSPKLGEKVAHIVDGFVGAMKQLPDAKNLAMFFAWTAIYWGLNGWGMAVLSRAFEPNHLTTFQGFVVLGVLIGGLMIPAAPGSAGTFQAFIMVGMNVFLPDAVVKSSGFAFANLLWLMQIGQQILFGLILMATAKASFKGITGKLEETQAQQATS